MWIRIARRARESALLWPKLRTARLVLSSLLSKLLEAWGRDKPCSRVEEPGRCGYKWIPPPGQRTWPPVPWFPSPVQQEMCGLSPVRHYSGGSVTKLRERSLIQINPNPRGTQAMSLFKNDPIKYANCKAIHMPSAENQRWAHIRNYYIVQPPEY